MYYASSVFVFITQQLTFITCLLWQNDWPNHLSQCQFTSRYIHNKLFSRTTREIHFNLKIETQSGLWPTKMEDACAEQHHCSTIIQTAATSKRVCFGIYKNNVSLLWLGSYIHMDHVTLLLRTSAKHRAQTCYAYTQIRRYT